ncbi:MAG TPA: hypothetical protein VLY23_02510 [Candidatus Acidoferrum sp.]|nr:hypothetical protein [Candidatus Acidoferrum sp.]
MTSLIRKRFTLLGSVVVLALLLAALAPRAARGVAAALVQVTNTASNAVPTVNGPGNFPFVATTCGPWATEEASCGSLQPGFIVPHTTSTGAAVKRLVIEEVSTICDIGDGATINPRVLVDPPADHVIAGTVPEFLFSPTASSTAHIYADPGSEVATLLAGTNPNGSSAVCLFTLMGHLETQ